MTLTPEQTRDFLKQRLMSELARISQDTITTLQWLSSQDAATVATISEKELETLDRNLRGVRNIVEGLRSMEVGK